MCVATLEPHAFSALSNVFTSHPPFANGSNDGGPGAQITMLEVAGRT